MVYLTESYMCDHTLTGITVTDGRIHITLTRSVEGAELVGSRFILIPVEDPEGKLAGCDVSFAVKDK